MKVSVLIITYNHERYIAKALDGVLMQETDFEYEIVIGEDCSTDNTRKILTEYARRFPGRFKLLLHEQNVGGPENFDRTFQACTGEYLALLNGDDYWTSPLKLQKQADLLDNHPEYAVSFHGAQIRYEDGSCEPARYRESQKSISTVEDLLLDNFIPTSAVMFRACNFRSVPGWISALKMGDWPIHILNALHGSVCYIDESMSDYIVHRSGVWSSKDWRDHEPAIIQLFEALLIHLPRQYSGVVRRILQWRNFSLSERFEYFGDLGSARKHCVKSMLQHLSLLCANLRFHRRADADAADFLPAYMKSVTSAKLVKTFLGLSIEPLLKPYPILHKSLRTAARMMNISL